MPRTTLPAIALLIATTLIYACTAAKAPTTNDPTTNGPLPPQSGKVPTINRDIAGKLFARNNKATPKGDIKVATLFKDDALGVVIGNYQVRVQPTKTLSTQSEVADDQEDDSNQVGEMPTGTDAQATAKPTPPPADGGDEDEAIAGSGSDQTAHAAAAADEEWNADEWDANSDPSDDEWLDPEAKDDPEDIDSFGETEARFRGGAPHHLVFHENDYPVMDDERDSLTIEDQSAGKKRATISVDQDFLNFTITGSSGKTVSITVNPDGTCTVDGKTVGTVKEAARLINAALSKDEMTNETLAFLYGALRSRDGMIRTLIPSIGNPSAPGDNDDANGGGASGDVITPTGLVRTTLEQRQP